MLSTLPTAAHAPLLRNADPRAVAFEPLLTIDRVSVDDADAHLCEADGCGAVLIEGAYEVHVFGEARKLSCSWVCSCDLLGECGL